VLNNIVAELRALDFRRAVHLAGKVIGNAFAANRAVQTFDERVGGFPNRLSAGTIQLEKRHRSGTDWW
jgi:hypothetical protein